VESSSISVALNLKDRFIFRFTAAAISVPLLLSPAENIARAADGRVQTLDLRGRSNTFVALAMDKVVSGKTVLVVNGGDDVFFNFIKEIAHDHEINELEDVLVIRTDDNDNNPLQTRIEIFQGHAKTGSVDVRPAADRNYAEVAISKLMRGE